MRILDNLQDWERLTVADALESVSFDKGRDIGPHIHNNLYNIIILYKPIHSNAKIGLILVPNI